jgi:hypothetical protein
VVKDCHQEEERMKNKLIWGLLAAACVVASAASLTAVEKAAPESYTAKVVPLTNKSNGSAGGGADLNQSKFSVQMYDVVGVEIGEFCTDEEVRDLAQTYRDGGDKALEKALYKSKRGYFRIGQGPQMDIVYVTSSKVLKNPPDAPGPSRILGILGRVPTSFRDKLGQNYEAPQVPHTFTYVELRVDDQGNGTGMIILYAMVGFDAQNRPVIKPLAKHTYQLGEVKSGK